MPGQATAVESGAGGTIFMTNVYSDGQRDLHNIDLTLLNKNTPELMDDAQCITQRPYSMNITTNNVFYLTNSDVKQCGSTSNCGRCGGTYLATGISQLSAASDKELWGVNQANQIVQWDFTNGRFLDQVPALAPPGAVVKLEAGNGVDHWIVTAQDRIFHYIPPGAAPAAPPAP
jgi:hypothetical protein